MNQSTLDQIVYVEGESDGEDSAGKESVGEEALK